MRGEFSFCIPLVVVLMPAQGCILLSDCGVMDGSCGLILGGIDVSPAVPRKCACRYRESTRWHSDEMVW
jgi:hypothetical protein